MAQPNCRDCKHFFITWNQATPNGCRQYGIQSKELPSAIVYQAGSGDCQGFEPKIRPENKEKKLDLNDPKNW